MMKVSIWDTYVKRNDGRMMHFDIIVPSYEQNESTIYKYGEAYLKRKPFDTNNLSTKACNFCHIEQATPKMIDEISKIGFSIIEMENCI